MIRSAPPPSRRSENESSFPLYIMPLKTKALVVVCFGKIFEFFFPEEQGPRRCHRSGRRRCVCIDRIPTTRPQRKIEGTQPPLAQAHYFQSNANSPKKNAISINEKKRMIMMTQGRWSARVSDRSSPHHHEPPRTNERPPRTTTNHDLTGGRNSLLPPQPPQHEPELLLPFATKKEEVSGRVNWK